MSEEQAAQQDIQALAKGGRTNFFGFLLRLLGTAPFLFIAGRLYGVEALGDLVLTCSSTASRNFSLGKALGEGQTAAQALADKTSVAEGAHTAPVLAELASRDGIDMPIVLAVARLLRGDAPARQVVAELLARPLKAEGPQA